MFKSLIVATDLSPASFAVVSCLGSLRAYGIERCLLVQCLSLQDVAATALSYTTQHLESMLVEQKSILERAGFAVETRVVPGFAKQEINRIADKEDFPLVVVGSLGHSMVKEAMLGGVAYGVIHSSRQPVLVIPVKRVNDGESTCCTERGDFTGHVLFPTDFSANADRAFGILKKMVAAGIRRVTLLHILAASMDDQASGRQNQDEPSDDLVRGRLDAMRQALQRPGNAEVGIEIRKGSPFLEITRLVDASDVQLVVMGSQGSGFVKELFLGSVSHNVTRHSIAPVLLVPAER